MLKPILKKRLLILTLFFYFLFITGFTYSDKFGLLKDKHQNVFSTDVYGELRGIDPTPLPPEPPPNLQK